MITQAIATEQQNSPAPQSVVLSFLQTLDLAPASNIGGVVIGGRYDSTFGAIGEMSYATSLNDDWAAGLIGEYGSDTYRLSGTVGRNLWRDGQVKLTAEYLDQKLPFTFDSGRLDKRVQQSAYGLQLRQNLDNPIMRSIEGGAYMAMAPSHALSSVTIIDGGLAYTNQRNIAGSTSRGFNAGANFALDDSTLLTPKLLYDDIRYDTRYSSSSAVNRSALGASLQLDTLLSERVMMSLKTENRSLMDSYGTELRWHPESLPLDIGLLAQRMVANDNSPSSTVVGMNVRIAMGNEGYRSPVPGSSATGDLVNWVKTPAVRMERVQVHEDQRTTLNGPVTLSISPSGGPVTGGGTVTITGTNFLPGVVVTFSGVNATIVSVTSTQIVVTVPDLSLVVVDNSLSILNRMWAQLSPISTAYAATNTRDVPVVVTNPDGQTFTFNTPYVVTVSDPIITSLSPTSGTTAGGTSVTITGSTFTGATSVTFGGAAATSFSVVNDTTITAVTPAHAAGAVDVSVTTPQGSVTATGGFTYIDPTPTLSSVSPDSGITLGGTSVTLTGTHLTGTTSVTFGGVAATSFSVVNDTTVTAVTPAHAAGAVDVVITTPAGNVTESSGYTYIAPPAVTSLSPTSGATSGGTSVIITGTNFADATAVNFGSSAAASFTVDSATQITATSPAGSAGTVDVTVTSPLGTSATSGANQFTYVAAPTVTGLSPTSGATSGGTSVVITGTGFTAVDVVNFGSTPATSFTVDSDTQITAVAPADSAGTVDVTVTSEGGISDTSSANQFTYVAAPTVTGISPDSGYTTGSTSVTITGTSFTDATAVNFGGAAASSYTVDSDTQITAVSPAGSAGVVDITVTTAGGTSATSSADQFTYNAPPPIIYVTSSSYDGNLGGFSGADNKCNSDSAKPSSGFAADYTYKALLNGNNATTSGVTYYRTNGTTSVATATGGNLVGASSLINAISSSSAGMWTGGNGSNSCSSWTSSNSGVMGAIGNSSSSTSTYWSSSSAACNGSRKLYCVSQ